jgi:two-component system nitrogen regulation sensor histidine kinase NtrY
LPALLIVAVAISLLHPATENLNDVARKIQNKLNAGEAIFESAFQDPTFHAALLSNEEAAPQIEDMENKGILLFYYRNDSLIHWTTNSVLPLSLPAALPEGTSFVREKNGWYQLSKSRYSKSRELLIGLMAVKFEYPFENKFLKNDFALGLNVPHNIEISEQQIKGSVPVKNIKGTTLFSLYVSGDEKGEDLNYVLLISQILFLLLLLFYINSAAVRLVKGRGFVTGFIFVAVAMLAVRIGMLEFDKYLELSKLDLFNPKFYASSFLTPSLGDLIIDTLLITWLIFFAEYYQALWRYRILHKTWAAGLMTALVFVITALGTWVFKTLVMDSVISFEVYNILSLTYYSFLGIICLALLFIAHFFITRHAVVLVNNSKIKPIYIFLFTLVCTGIYLWFSFGSAFYQVVVFSGLWVPVHLLLVSFILKKDPQFNVRSVILYIALYSILSTYLTENLYERKERNQRKFFASRLVTERDFIAEYMFGDVADRINTDAFIKNFLADPVISKRDVNARLSSLYLSGYFNKYDIRVNTFDKEDNPIKNRDTFSLQHFYGLINSDSVKTGALYYIKDTSQNFSYLAFFRFSSDTGQVGELVLRLIPKVYSGQNVYPELLLGENVSNLADNTRYNYAIYRHNKLIIQHGEFPYSYYWSKDFQFNGKQYVFIDIGDWEHIIYNFANDMKVVVTEKQEGLFEPVATFSYLFTFYFIAVMIGFIIARFLAGPISYSAVFDELTLSFRTRINYSMLTMIVISFIIIGFITISFFSRQYNNFYTDRLLRKEKVLHAGLEYFIQQNANSGETLSSDRLSNALSFEVARMAEINDIDINLYDDEGTLSVASQPAIYDKGLISKKMNPDAYFELLNTKGAQVTEQENIGELNYLAIYAPIRNGQGESIAYLGIPYFERAKNVSDEVSSFLVALMNVYVFLLICAAVLAYFISNSITRPLTIISEKLRILNLNKRNEPIEWKSKDEIGVLIGEYNKMIKELEQSAHKLARSERESAWREMAKQIAHEIKNPLTPMKLSIQYLQRAISANDPNVVEMARKVSRTLEEQIENLSSIATAFSSFAKMPKAENEIINLNDLLKSITDLFNREKATVTYSTEVQHPLVFADKNQLVSVFNNLIKNAIQSIPEHRKGFVDVHILEADGWITVSVNDNGNGIPRENYDKVFVPNFTTKSSGTGLGLAISKQIIEGAGGDIWFDSKENVGTSFFVRLRKSDSL